MYKVLIPTVISKRKLFKYDETFYNELYSKWISKKEQYESIFLYNDIHCKKLEESGSLSGITDVITDQVVFDFDDKLDVKNALNDAKTLVNSLLSDGFTKDEILCFYSSNKGFHVTIRLKTPISYNDFIDIIMSYGSSLRTFDTQVSDTQRIFRLPLSYNPKSNRYKVPIDTNYFIDKDFDLDALIEYAESPDIEYALELISKTKHADFKFKIKEKLPITGLKTVSDRQVMDDVPDFTQKPKHLTNVKYALQEGFFEPGERNEAYNILAATYKFFGYSKEIAYNMLKATDRLHVNRLRLKGIKREARPKEAIWHENIEHVYSPNYNGGTYSEKTNELLIKTRQRYNIPDDKELNPTINIDSVADFTLNFAKNADQNRILLGIESIDKDVMISTGMLVALLGAASSSKTTLALNIIRNLSLNGQTVLFNSLDMYTPFILARLLQRYEPLSFEDVTNELKDNQFNGKLKKAWEQVQAEFKNVRFNFKSGPTVEDIENHIKNIEKESGKAPKLVVIDYLEKIAGPYTDSTANSGFIAGRLADLARDYNTCILLLVQPQKSAGTPADELLSYRNIKGSSRLEQDCRVVLTVWRPGFNPEDNSLDKYASIAVVKNNMGSVFKRNFRFNGAKGTYEPITSVLQSEFEEDMREINYRKMEKARQKEHGYRMEDDL